MLISLRHQDWVIKIDYAGGTGSGALLWRLGAGGDFAINSADPCPWFSGQHDANFQDPGMTVLSLFDNANTLRAQCNPNGNSRGYVLNVNQATKQVTPTLLADLGAFSTGLGTAQLLPGAITTSNWAGLCRGPSADRKRSSRMQQPLLRCKNKA